MKQNISPIKAKGVGKEKKEANVKEEAWMVNLQKFSKSGYHGDLWSTKGEYNDGENFPFFPLFWKKHTSLFSLSFNTDLLNHYIYTGLVYLSRFSKPESFNDPKKEKEQSLADTAKDIQESLDTSTLNPDSDKLRAKKRCASALSSLSWDSDFEHQIVNEVNDPFVPSILCL